MFGNLKKLSHILTTKQKRMVVVLALMILIGGVLETIGISAVIPVVGAIIDRQGMMNNAYVQMVCNAVGVTLTEENFNGFILALLIGLVLVIVIKNLFLTMMTYVQARFINNNRFQTVSYMLEEYLNRPYEFYLNVDIPTVFRMIDSDVPNVFTILMEYIQLASEVVVSFLICVLLLIVDWKMCIVIGAILVIVTGAVLRLMKPELNRMGLKSQEVQARMGKWRLQSIYGIKDVKILHKESFFAQNFRKYSVIAGQVTSRYAVMNSIPRTLIETVCMAALMGYVGMHVLSGEDLTGIVTQIAAFGYAATRLIPSVNRISGHMTNIAFFQASLDYIYENVDFSDYSSYGEYRDKDASDIVVPVKDEIRMEHIHYTYPDSDRPVLVDALMRIPVGKSVGVMGPSGAGKTTAIDILMGLLKAQKGEITCGGVNIFDNYPGWLAHIGYIPQTIYLTDDSLRENIAFGVAKDDIDDARIWQVLEEAQMKEYVESMPGGIYTTVGDRGVRLSGGQRQRIGIARALYHNPEILVFDEATSALDTDTETAIMEAIENFHGKKTMIIIAHRLRTIENCDIIYRVDKNIIEATKGNELLV